MKINYYVILFSAMMDKHVIGNRTIDVNLY